MSSPKTLFEKIWSAHVVKDLGDGRALIHIDRHVLQEGTCPQAFADLRKMSLPVRSKDLTYAVIDHSVASAPGRTADTFQPTRWRIVTMQKNCRDFGVELFDIDDPRQGITHVIAPELGITVPGATLVCADSHTATNGGLGAWAWGIGTTEVRHVLANQALIMHKANTMRVNYHGAIGPGVFAKDLILYLIGQHGISAGVGYVVEYAGPVIRAMAIEGRMTICNMSIEFGARAGLIGVDETTIDYVASRPLAPKGAELDLALKYWRTMRSDDDSVFDRTLEIDCSRIVPQVTWGTTPQDVLGVDQNAPDPATIGDSERRHEVERALDYIGIKPRQPLEGVPIDVAFIGSCTNARLSDLREAAKIAQGRMVASTVRALIVPGSTAVKKAAEAEGLDKIFTAAGFEWRESSCSMCVATNGDTVAPGQRSMSTTNRNFEGRQGPGTRTHLASPAMVAAAAITGTITDVRKLLRS